MASGALAWTSGNAPFFCTIPLRIASLASSVGMTNSQGSIECSGRNESAPSFLPSSIGGGAFDDPGNRQTRRRVERCLTPGYFQPTFSTRGRPTQCRVLSHRFNVGCGTSKLTSSDGMRMGCLSAPHDRATSILQGSPPESSSDIPADDGTTAFFPRHPPIPVSTRSRRHKTWCSEAQPTFFRPTVGSRLPARTLPSRAAARCCFFC